MATRTYRPTAAGRRVLVADPRQVRRRRFTPDLLTLQVGQGLSSADTLRTRLELLIEEAIRMLDLLDGDSDAEPDFEGEEAHEGCCAAADDNPVSMPCRQHQNDFGAGTPEDVEAEADEGWAQPVTLAADRAPGKVIHLPRRLRLVEVRA